MESDSEEDFSDLQQQLQTGSEPLVPIESLRRILEKASRNLLPTEQQDYLVETGLFVCVNGLLRRHSLGKQVSHRALQLYLDSLSFAILKLKHGKHCMIKFLWVFFADALQSFHGNNLTDNLPDEELSAIADRLVESSENCVSHVKALRSCIVQEERVTSRYVLCVEHFCRIDGLQVVLNSISSGMSLPDTLCALQILLKLTEVVTPELALDLSSRAPRIVLDSLQTLEGNYLRQASRENIADLLHQVQQLALIACSHSEVNQLISQARLDIACKFLTCTHLQQRLIGLHEVCALTRNGQQNEHTSYPMNLNGQTLPTETLIPDDINRTDMFDQQPPQQPLACSDSQASFGTCHAIADKLCAEKVVESVFEPETMHFELLKRSSQLLCFLARCDKLSRDHLRIVWNTLSGIGIRENEQREAHRVLEELVQALNRDKLDFLWKLVTTVDTAELNQSMLSFIRTFTFKALGISSLYNNGEDVPWYGVEFLWDLIQDDGPRVCEQLHKDAIESLMELVSAEACKVFHRPRLLVRCIQNLKLFKSVPQSLHILRHILSMLTSQSGISAGQVTLEALAIILPENVDRPTASSIVPPSASTTIRTALATANVQLEMNLTQGILPLCLTELTHFKEKCIAQRPEFEQKLKTLSRKPSQHSLFGSPKHVSLEEQHFDNSKYSFLDALKGRLDFIQYIGSTWIVEQPTVEQLEVIWVALVDSSISSEESDLCMSWLQNMHCMLNDSDGKIAQQMLSWPTRLPLKQMTLPAFNFFMYLMRTVNIASGHFAPVRSESTGKDHAVEFRVVKPEFIGKGMLWTLALQAPDDQVATRAANLLLYCYQCSPVTEELEPIELNNTLSTDSPTRTPLSGTTIHCESRSIENGNSSPASNALFVNVNTDPSQSVLWDGVLHHRGYVRGGLARLKELVAKYQQEVNIQASTRQANTECATSREESNGEEEDNQLKNECATSREESNGVEEDNQLKVIRNGADQSGASTEHSLTRCLTLLKSFLDRSLVNSKLASLISSDLARSSSPNQDEGDSSGSGNDNQQDVTMEVNTPAKKTMDHELQVKCIQVSNSTCFNLELNSTNTVAELRQRIALKIRGSNEEKLIPSSIRIISAGKELTDGQTLHDAGVVDGQHLHIALRPRTNPTNLNLNSRDETFSQQQVQNLLFKISPYPILSEQTNFDMLFDLLSMPSAKIVVTVWDLLMAMPTNRQLLTAFTQVETGVSCDWEVLLSPQNVFKLLYSLQIMKMLLSRPVVKEQQSNPHQATTEWRYHVVATGGLERLVHIFITVDFEPPHLGRMRFECLALLLQVLNSLLPDQHDVDANVAQRTNSIAIAWSKFVTKAFLNRLGQVMQLVGNMTESTPKGKKHASASECVELQISKYCGNLLIRLASLHSNVLEWVFETESWNGLTQLQHWLVPVVLNFNLVEVQYSCSHTVLQLCECASQGTSTIAACVTSLLSAFVENLNDTVIKSSGPLGAYYDMLSKLVKINFGIVKKHCTGFDNHATLSKVFVVFESLQAANHKPADENTIVGFFSMLKSLLVCCATSTPLANEGYESVFEAILVNVFHKCLFYAPSQSRLGSKRGGMRCQTAYERGCAFDLLLHLVKCSKSCQFKLFKLVAELNSGTPNPPVSLPWIPTSLQLDHTNSRDSSLQDRERLWEYNTTLAEKSECGYVGLRNLGCTCYSNAVLQQLFMIPRLRQGILSVQIPSQQQGGLLYQVQRMFGYLQESDRKFYDTESFVSQSTELGTINVREQQDVHEFFTVLTDQLAACLRGSSQQDLLEYLFGGVLTNEVRCVGCPHGSELKEDFMVLQLEVKGKPSIERSLESYVVGERLEGGNRYYCHDCDTKRDAMKQSCITSLPNVLILHLKRIEYDFEKQQNVKVNDYCEFPLNLDMSPYTREVASHRESSEQDDGIQYLESEDAFQHPPEYYQYELKGIVVHVGTGESGHYFSYIKESGNDCRRWYCFNDITVEPFDESEIADNCFGGSGVQPEWDRDSASYKNRSFLRRKNACMLIYERSYQLQPTRDRVAKPMTCDTLQEVELSPEPSWKYVPQQIRESCWHENDLFQQDQRLLDPQFGQFILALGSHAVDVVVKSPHEWEASSQTALVEMLGKAVVNTCSHGVEEHTTCMLTLLIGKLTNVSCTAREMFLKLLVADGATWIRQMLLRCPKENTRTEFAKLVHECLCGGLEEERKLYLKHDMQALQCVSKYLADHNWRKSYLISKLSATSVQLDPILDCNDLFTGKGVTRTPAVLMEVRNTSDRIDKQSRDAMELNVVGVNNSEARISKSETLRADNVQAPISSDVVMGQSPERVETSECDVDATSGPPPDDDTCKGRACMNVKDQMNDVPGTSRLMNSDDDQQHRLAKVQRTHDQTSVISSTASTGSSASTSDSMAIAEQVETNSGNPGANVTMNQIEQEILKVLNMIPVLCSESRVLRLLGFMIAYISEAHMYHRNAGQFFSLLGNIVEFGPQELSIVLKLGGVTRLLSYFFEVFRTPARQVLFTGTDKHWAPSVTHLTATASHRDVKEFGMLIGVLLRSCSIERDEKVAELDLKHDSGLQNSKLINGKISEVQVSMIMEWDVICTLLVSNCSSDVMIPLVRHLCWGKLHFSKLLVEQFCFRIQDVNSCNSETYFQVFESLLELKDGCHVARAEYAVARLFAIIKRSINLSQDAVQVRAILALGQFVRNPSLETVRLQLLYSHDDWALDWLVLSQVPLVRLATEKLVLSFVDHCGTQMERDVFAAVLGAIADWILESTLETYWSDARLDLQGLNDDDHSSDSLYEGDVSETEFMQVGMFEGEERGLQFRYCASFTGSHLANLFRTLAICFQNGKLDGGFTEKHANRFVEIVTLLDSHKQEHDLDKGELMNLILQVFEANEKYLQIVVDNIEKFLGYYIVVRLDDHTTQVYNNKYIPSYYKLLHRCAQHEPVAARVVPVIAKHNNFSWAIRNFVLKDFQYHPIAESLLPLISIVSHSVPSWRRGQIALLLKTENKPSTPGGTRTVPSLLEFPNGSLKVLRDCLSSAVESTSQSSCYNCLYELVQLHGVTCLTTILLQSLREHEHRGRVALVMSVFELISTLVRNITSGEKHHADNSSLPSKLVDDLVRCTTQGKETVPLTHMLKQVANPWANSTLFDQDTRVKFVVQCRSIVLNMTNANKTFGGKTLDVLLDVVPKWSSSGENSLGDDESTMCNTTVEFLRLGVDLVEAYIATPPTVSGESDNLTKSRAEGGHREEIVPCAKLLRLILLHCCNEAAGNSKLLAIHASVATSLVPLIKLNPPLLQSEAMIQYFGTVLRKNILDKSILQQHVAIDKLWILADDSLECKTKVAKLLEDCGETLLSNKVRKGSLTLAMCTQPQVNPTQDDMKQTRLHSIVQVEAEVGEEDPVDRTGANVA